jgi:hypothetical protein
MLASAQQNASGALRHHVARWGNESTFIWPVLGLAMLSFIAACFWDATLTVLVPMGNPSKMPPHC